MSKRKVQVIKPYTYRDNFIDKLSIKDRAYLELVREEYENAELEGEPDRPVNIKREQVKARVAEKKRKEKEQLKRYRLLIKAISNRGTNVGDRWLVPIEPFAAIIRCTSPQKKLMQKPAANGFVLWYSRQNTNRLLSR
jgi:hypothetical protein